MKIFLKKGMQYLGERLAGGREHNIKDEKTAQAWIRDGYATAVKSGGSANKAAPGPSENKQRGGKS